MNGRGGRVLVFLPSSPRSSVEGPVRFVKCESAGGWWSMIIKHRHHKLSSFVTTVLVVILYFVYVSGGGVSEWGVELQTSCLVVYGHGRGRGNDAACCV